MTTSRLAAAVLSAACATASTCAAAADFEAARPSLYWGMEFGSPVQAPSLRYGFALRQVETEPGEAPLPALATMDFSAQGAGLRLAGMPVWQRQYRTSQAETPAAEGAATESEGGFLSGLGDAFAGLGIGTGTVLVAGGVAVAVMLLSTDADDDYGGGGSPGGPGEDECDVPAPFPPMSGCTLDLGFAGTAGSGSEVASATPWLDHGSGQMGDLFAH